MVSVVAGLYYGHGHSHSHCSCHGPGHARKHGHNVMIMFVMMIILKFLVYVDQVAKQHFENSPCLGGDSGVK